MIAPGKGNDAPGNGAPGSGGSTICALAALPASMIKTSEVQPCHFMRAI